MKRERATWGALVALAASGAMATTAQAAAPEAIARFDAATAPAQRVAAVRAARVRVTRDLHIIDGVAVRGDARGLRRLAAAPGVRSIMPNAPVATRGSAGPLGEDDARRAVTSFVQSTRAEKTWLEGSGGAGVAIAVIDTGVAGALPDFADRRGASRVRAAVVTNPAATTAEDRYGHGTHVAGIAAGRSEDHFGTAPNADLVSIKVSDDHGAASVIDVIAGLQFAVDHKVGYGIRVVNLSLASAERSRYREDPLDAAAEAAWFSGLVVVAAAGNDGTGPAAVSSAPGNDPYVITVGAVDDEGSKVDLDDKLAPWSSRGTTQDGVAKPELVAPGMHIEAPLAPRSDFAEMCPSCAGGGYFRASGTSMAAPVVSGIAADLLAAHPAWTPDQVKAALTATLRRTADGAGEVDAQAAIHARPGQAAQAFPASSLIDPATGNVDYARATWTRATWKAAGDALGAPWAAATWSCACGGAGSAVDPTRATWKRATWRSFLGETPAQYGELAGGTSGAERPVGGHGRTTETGPRGGMSAPVGPEAP